jgi:hypothetical protein
MSARRLLLLLFLVWQAWDGIFTYFGVASFGLGIEGNRLLATWMTLVGPATALVGAKLLAGVCGGVLYLCNATVPLAVLNAYYGVQVVGSWVLFYCAEGWIG